MQGMTDLFSRFEISPPPLKVADASPRRAPSTLDNERFCAWRGRSGRRYVTSIYSFDKCPDYEHVVALAVRREMDGSRTALCGIDLGAFPFVALNGEAMKRARTQGANEVHLHLLAETQAARAAAIEDLV
ncbi:MAG: hypothetical protein ABWZ80_03700 [Beijerinckiaceae bacterium]